MADNTLAILHKEFLTRVNGIPGGNRPPRGRHRTKPCCLRRTSPAHSATSDMKRSRSQIVTSIAAILVRSQWPRGAATFTKSTDAGRAYMFIISTKTVDTENDVIPAWN